MNANEFIEDIKPKIEISQKCNPYTKKYYQNKYS